MPQQQVSDEDLLKQYGGQVSDEELLKQYGAVIAPTAGGRIGISPSEEAIAAHERAPGIPLFQPSPLPTDQPQQPRTYLGEAIVNPAKQMAAGYSSTAAGTAHLGANIADLIEAGISPSSPASSLMQVSAPGAYMGANVAGLLDTALGHISSLTGQDRKGVLGQFADWLRGQEQAYAKQAQDLSGNRQDFVSQMYRSGSQALTSLPLYMGASAAAGPVGGMALMGALETADQGPLNTLLGAGEGAVMGGFLHVLSPAGRTIRIPIVAATTYAQLRLSGVDPESAAAQAMTMAGLTGTASGGASVREVGRAMKETAGAVLPPYRSTLDPTKQAAIDYLRSEGVPLTAGQQTGNRYLRAVETTTGHMPVGSETAQEFHRDTGEAIGALSERLAHGVHPTPQTEYTAGKSVAETYNRKIGELNEQANEHYRQAWQGKGDERYTENVQIGTKQEPILDSEGNTTGGVEDVPVMGKVNMPVDVRWLKDLARDQIPKFEFLPSAELAQSNVYSILKNVLKLPDHITAEQGEEALKGFKSEAGYGENPALRDVSQGTAAGIIPRLQAGVDAAVGKTGAGNLEALRAGRRTHAEKMGLSETEKKLRDEPVQAFNQLTQGRDTGVDFLNEIAKEAPDSMPLLARAWIDKVFKLATQEGGWERARGILKQYQNLGDKTKKLMFPNASMRQALDNFFLGQKIVAEQINPSGTELTRTAKEATLNPFKWFQGWAGSKLFYTPKGIQFLTGVVQNPPRTQAEIAKVRARAEEIAGPPEGGTEAGGTPEPQQGPPRAGGGGSQTPIQIGQPLHEELQSIADQAARRIKERGTWRSSSAVVPGMADPRDIKDLVQWGAAKMGQGIVAGPLWRREMIGQFGRIPRDQMDKIYEQAKEHEITKNVKDWRPGMMLSDIHPLTSEIIPKRESQLSVPDVQRYLQNMVRERLGEIPDDAPDQVKMRRMMEVTRKEFRDQMKQPYSGVDWYGPDTRLGDQQLRQKFPELREKTYNTLQKAMSAAMSNNSNPLAEAYNGARIWEMFRKTGEFPLKQPNGKNWPAQGIKFQIEKLNKLIDELGPDEAALFLHEDHPGAEIKYFVPNAKEIRLGDYYPGSRILGPKIGNYFSNIMDLPQEGTAVDVWEMRRRGRILGKLFDARGRVIESPRTEAERNLVMDVHRRMARENDIDPRDAQSVGWHYEQGLYRLLGLPVKSFRRSLGIQKYLEELER